MRKCQKCKVNDAEWIVQYVSSDTPTFTLPGSHYRGFSTLLVCNSCKAAIEAEAKETIGVTP